MITAPILHIKKVSNKPEGGFMGKNILLLLMTLSLSMIAHATEKICAAEVLGTPLVIKINVQEVLSSQLGAKIHLLAKNTGKASQVNCHVTDLEKTEAWVIRRIQCDEGSYRIESPGGKNTFWPSDHLVVYRTCVENFDAESRGCNENTELSCELQF